MNNFEECLKEVISANTKDQVIIGLSVLIRLVRNLLTLKDSTVDAET
jgi:hypothetical protein